jgi:hypothetical protein
MHRTARPPTSSRSRGRTAPRCQRQGMYAEADSAKRQAACNRRLGRRRRPHRRHVDAEAQERGPALHPPRRRTLRHVQWAAPSQTATPSIGERLRRKTSRVPRTAPAQSTVSTMETQRLIGHPMYTNDHCRRHVGLLQQPAPPRDSLTVSGEDDCFGWVRWNVHRHLPSPLSSNVSVTNSPETVPVGLEAPLRRTPLACG